MAARIYGRWFTILQYPWTPATVSTENQPVGGTSTSSCTFNLSLLNKIVHLLHRWVNSAGFHTDPSCKSCNIVYRKKMIQIFTSGARGHPIKLPFSSSMFMEWLPPKRVVAKRQISSFHVQLQHFHKTLGSIPRLGTTVVDSYLVELCCISN